MKTVTEHIRDRLLRKVAPERHFDICEKSPYTILNEEMDWQFLAEMGYGMIMGYFRYGPAEKSTINNLEEAKRRIERYEKTGNQECLRDAANFLMQERRKPSIEGTHFTPIDDGEHAQEGERC